MSRLFQPGHSIRGGRPAGVRNKLHAGFLADLQRERRLGRDGVSVELDPANSRGACNEGPWHGSLRGPRNACGQWLRWVAMETAGEADTAR